MEYKKFLYEQKKREKIIKAKSTKVIVKEIRFGPNTDEHDYEFKKKHGIKFLKEGAKLKAFVFFKFIIMFISIRSKSNFLDCYFSRFRFYNFFSFLLFI